MAGPPIYCTAGCDACRNYAEKLGVELRTSGPLSGREAEVYAAGRLAGFEEGIDTLRAEYQRFYDFVADADPSIVDAWHFGENNRLAREARKIDG